MHQITNQETMVFDIVQEYLNENRTFDYNKILPYIVSRFAKSSINISTKGIIKHLERLTEKNMIVEGSKLTKNDVLINLKRKKLYEFIVERPGVYFNQIVNKLKLANHVVIWHVQILLKFNFIKVHEIDNREVYFETTVDLKNIEPLHIASHDKAKKILEFLRLNNTGLTKTKIAKELNMHINTITKYLDSLESIQAIIKENIGNKILYFLIENYPEEAQQDIVLKNTRKLLKEE